ncbi:hypothetical protein [Nocardia camponoti]|uniref:hypothetical protein n=1 Tax=Nocardia camponoti TaxID=1616106 RepID=UPI0016675773|nr:hypothetical protein [Nocardia camponoti]
MTDTQSPVSTDEHSRGERSMPSVNIAAHVRKLVRVLPFALIAALLVGGGVWFVRESSPRTYEASITAQISQQSIGAVFNELTQPYIVMLTDTRVLSDVVKNGLAPSEADLRKRVSAITGPSPSLLIIKAQASTPEQAAKLVVAVEESLDSLGSQMRSEAIRRSATDLESHRRTLEDSFAKELVADPLRPELSFDGRDVARETEFRQIVGPARLTVIAAPTWELVAPHPIQEALFAALATLIVVAEGLVIAGVARGRRRTKPAEQKSVEPTVDEKDVPTVATPTTPTPPTPPPTYRPAPRAPLNDRVLPPHNGWSATNERGLTANERDSALTKRPPVAEQRGPEPKEYGTGAKARDLGANKSVPVVKDPAAPASGEAPTAPAPTAGPPAPEVPLPPRRATPVAPRSTGRALSPTEDPETTALPRNLFSQSGKQNGAPDDKPSTK